MSINKKLALAIPMMLIIFLFIFMVFTNEFYDRPKAYEDESLNGPYDVERVVDGDTFIAWVEGDRTRIRMIGIDAPESVADNPDRITEEGILASDYTKQLLTGAEVYLEYDVEKYDKYGRLLAYVYIEDGRDYIFINKLLVDEGFARGYIIKPNTKYAHLLK